MGGYAPENTKEEGGCAPREELSRDKRNDKLLSVLGAIFFLMAVAITVATGSIPYQVLLVYLVASALTYFLYALDKSAARAGAWRTQESTLHGLSLLGGWPGALIAQQVLRHKSKKEVEGLVAKSVGLFPERLCAQHQPGIGAMSDYCQDFDV